MATIGLSDVYVAKYGASGGTVSYTGGIKLAKAVEVDISISTATRNVLRADNADAEVDSRFSGGTLKYTPDDLMQDELALILGITESAVTGDAGTQKELVYNDDANPPDIGWGGVVKKQKNGALKYRAIVLSKIKFKLPEETAKTEGETIDWQTPTLEADIMRADDVKHTWKRESTFDAQADAVAYVKTALGITGTEGG